MAGLKWIFILASYLVLYVSSQSAADANVTTLYYGFFFDYATASSIKFATDQYLFKTVTNPEFSKFLKNISNNAGISDMLDYYRKPVDPNTHQYDPYYHITAKFCGVNQAACEEYKETNERYINLTFEMHLVGYVFTNRTFGIRVNLTSEELPLFDEHSKSISNFNSSDTSNKSKNKNEKADTNTDSFLPGIRLEYLDYPTSIPASTTKAHSTFGCAPGVAAVTTGPDMLQAIDFETGVGNVSEVLKYELLDPVDPQGRNMTLIFYKTKSGKLEDFVFIIYPRNKLVANATLSPYLQPESSSATFVQPMYTFCICLTLLIVNSF